MWARPRSVYFVNRLKLFFTEIEKIEAERSNTTAAAPSAGVKPRTPVPPGDEESQMAAVVVHQPQVFNSAGPTPYSVERQTSAPSGGAMEHQTFTAAASALLQSRAAKLRQVNITGFPTQTGKP